MIDVKLKDGSSLQVEQGSTVAEVAKSIGMGLYKAPGPPGGRRGGRPAHRLRGLLPGDPDL